MWASVVVKAYPVADHAAGMLQGFKAVPVGTLLFERSNESSMKNSFPAHQAGFPAI